MVAARKIRFKSAATAQRSVMANAVINRLPVVKCMLEPPLLLIFFYGEYRIVTALATAIAFLARNGTIIAEGINVFAYRILR